MKRTAPLKRSPLRRGKPISRKRKPGKYADAAALQDFRETRESCAACWKHFLTFGVILQTHHILNGSLWGKADDRRNLLRLCAPCHRELDKGRDNFPVVLALKRESDPEYFDPAWMQEHCRNFNERYILPQPAERYPDWIVTARATWSDR